MNAFQVSLEKEVYSAGRYVLNVGPKQMWILVTYGTMVRFYYYYVSIMCVVLV